MAERETPWLREDNHGIITTGVHGAGTDHLLSTGDIARKNAIINGCMRVAQRGISFTAATAPLNSDDTYLLDRWILLSDGNDIVDVSQVVRATPNGAYAECKLEVETANKQFGLLTILEARDAARFIGKTVSLSFKARMAAADDNTHSLKAVILSWDGAADIVTSDVVDTWQASPVYVANWTAENTPASKTLTTTEQTFKVEGVAIDTASIKNIAVFIFCDQTDGAVDDAVIITGVQLELGSIATLFEFRLFEQELSLCQRYYQKSYPYVSIPGSDMTGNMGASQVAVHIAFLLGWGFIVSMRAVPTISIWSRIGTSAKVTLFDTAGDIGTVVTAGQATEHGIGYMGDSGDNFTVGKGYDWHYVAVAEL